MQSTSAIDTSAISPHNLVVRTTVALQVSLLDLTKNRAAEEGLSVSEVIENALRQHFSTKKEQAPPAEFVLPKVHGRPLRHGFDLDRTSALLVADDEELAAVRR